MSALDGFLRIRVKRLSHSLLTRGPDEPRPACLDSLRHPFRHRAGARTPVRGRSRLLRRSQSDGGLRSSDGGSCPGTRHRGPEHLEQPGSDANGAFRLGGCRRQRRHLRHRGPGCGLQTTRQGRSLHSRRRHPGCLGSQGSATSEAVGPQWGRCDQRQACSCTTWLGTIGQPRVRCPWRAMAEPRLRSTANCT